MVGSYLFGNFTGKVKTHFRKKGSHTTLVDKITQLFNILGVIQYKDKMISPSYQLVFQPPQSVSQSVLSLSSTPVFAANLPDDPTFPVVHCNTHALSP